MCDTETGSDGGGTNLPSEGIFVLQAKLVGMSAMEVMIIKH